MSSHVFVEIQAPVLHKPTDRHVRRPHPIPPPAFQRRRRNSRQFSGLLRVEVGAVNGQRAFDTPKSFDDLFHATESDTVPGRRNPSLVGQQPVSYPRDGVLQVPCQVAPRHIAERDVAAGMIEQHLQCGEVDACQSPHQGSTSPPAP